MPVNRDYLQKRQSDGEKSPILYPYVVEGVQGLPPGEAPDVLMATVMDATLFRRGTMARLEFYEYPGYVLFARNGELMALADHLGADEGEWQRKRVVLEKVRRRDSRGASPAAARIGSDVIKYVVAPTEAW